MADRIQTGLRIPEEQYKLLKETADKAGISVNAQILYLIEIGMQAINLGIEEERRVLSRTQRDTGGERTRSDC